MIPTSREWANSKKWNPHGSLHKDGSLHHKSYNRKAMAVKKRKPNADFKGRLNLVLRPTASHEPRAFGIICNPNEFTDVMEVPVGVLSSKRYGTHITVDLTEPDCPPMRGPAVFIQQSFDDSIPWIWVSVVGEPLLAT